MASVVNDGEVVIQIEKEPNHVPKYSKEYVEKCNTNEKFWVYSGSTIYDITHFRRTHPGGAHVFNNKGGKDITSELKYHTKRTRDSLFMYEIGKIKDSNQNKQGCIIS